MKRKKNRYSDFKIAAYLNQQTYNDFYNQLLDIYLSAFQWKGLPETMNSRFIEINLFYSGSVAVFEDDYIGLMNTLYNQIGRPDYNENPKRIYAYTNTGYHRFLGKNDFVIIWANRVRIPPMQTLALYAYRLYETERTTDTNIKGLKNPKILKGNEGQKMTLDNLVMKIDGNIPYILLKDNFEGELGVLDLSTEYLADKLDIHKERIWNKFLTWIGVENANLDKKERLVSNEVNGNYGNVEISRNSGLMCRQEAAEEINKRFGTNIEVTFNSSIPTLLNQAYRGDD